MDAHYKNEAASDVVSKSTLIDAELQVHWFVGWWRAEESSFVCSVISRSSLGSLRNKVLQKTAVVLLRAAKSLRNQSVEIPQSFETFLSPHRQQPPAGCSSHLLPGWIGPDRTAHGVAPF
ncbi:unnamed protein product [Dicrocoelium dendriticum]|nr:unnamed protein product [Dicrocoelium dendriticum]